MIRVLPPQPRGRPVHTCPYCGCHVVSYVAMDGGWHASYLKVCSWCLRVYRKPSMMDRIRETREREIAEAVESVTWE